MSVYTLFNVDPDPSGKPSLKWRFEWRSQSWINVNLIPVTLTRFPSLRPCIYIVRLRRDIYPQIDAHTPVSFSLLYLSCFGCGRSQIFFHRDSKAEKWKNWLVPPALKSQHADEFLSTAESPIRATQKCFPLPKIPKEWLPAALRPSGSIMGPSGDIMFGPWTAYFPVSLCHGCDIVTLPTSLSREHSKCSLLGDIMNSLLTSTDGWSPGLLGAYITFLMASLTEFLLCGLSSAVSPTNAFNS